MIRDMQGIQKSQQYKQERDRDREEKKYTGSSEGKKSNHQDPRYGFVPIFGSIPSFVVNPENISKSNQENHSQIKHPDRENSIQPGFGCDG
jgi:hypothetical protein